ncbi:MAG: hypothetical protein AB7V77_01035 [Candidatus Woesearchaeota archaeon]
MKYKFLTTFLTYSALILSCSTKTINDSDPHLWNMKYRLGIPEKNIVEFDGYYFDKNNIESILNVLSINNKKVAEIYNKYLNNKNITLDVEKILDKYISNFDFNFDSAITEDEIKQRKIIEQKIKNDIKFL